MNLEELMASTPPMQQHALIKGFQAGAASRDAEVPESLVLGDPLYKKGFEAGRQAEREECVDIYKSLFNLYLDRGYPEQQMAFLIAAIDDFIEAVRARGDMK